jgi:Zn finger protein HypA/HybF involved in hydrogenase expression
MRHDPHGSSNVYHLKDTVNGVSGLTILDPKGHSEVENQEAWCAACHMIRSHEWRGSHCIDCHSHARDTQRRF